VLLKSGEPVPTVIMFPRKSIAQQPVHALPRREHLGALVLMRQPPLRVENLAGGDVHTEIVGREANIAQPSDEFLLRHDSRAATGQFAVHPLVDVDVPPGPAQQQGAEQPTHRAANDDGAHPRRSRQLTFLNLFDRGIILYMTLNSTGGLPWL